LEDIRQTVGELFDVSDIMQNKITVACEAPVKFLELGNRDDEFFVVEFSGRAEVATDFTANFARLRSS
jgi:hypothetical protein